MTSPDTFRLLQSVARKTGLHDYGDPRFLDGLEALLEAIAAERRFSAMGRLIVGRVIRQYLRNRLLITESLRQSPEINWEHLRRPLFIVGLNRTGTTLIHNLLALADDTRAPRSWELIQPAPPCLAGDREAKRRQRRARWTLAALHTALPQLKVVHPIGADDIEECYPLVNHTFASPALSMHYGIPRYGQWLESLDLGHERWVIQSYMRQLKLMEVFQPGRRWILKSAVHLYFLEALLQEIPDAMIVQTHRDPCQTIPSTCSLVACLRKIVYRTVEPRAIGQECLDLAQRVLARGRKARGDHPAAAVVDVAYEDLVDDPIGQVRRIHEQFGLGWSDSHVGRMHHWLATHRAGRNGTHVYHAEEYGLRPEDLRSLFAGEVAMTEGVAP